MKVVIMAGGKGTRIASINATVPKPMILVNEKPILEHQIQGLKRQGYTEYILVVGYLGHIITEYFGDGSTLGVSIEYIVEETPLGTAGALYYLRYKLTEDFLLINGDIIFDIDIERFYNRHKTFGATATLFTHPNNHPYDSGIVITDYSGCVKNWLHKEDKRNWYHNCVNAGLHMISPKIFMSGVFDKKQQLDLDRDVLKTLISTGQLYAYDSSEYVKDMGTPERLREVSADILSGKVYAANLKNRQKAIFLDRDGTINKYVGFLRNIEALELIPGAAEAVCRINKAGYLAIIITNQPVIARGEIAEWQLKEIHNKMEVLLGEKGAFVNAIYYCPHHPDRGFDGERKELKIDCQCRKPKAGLLLKAAQDFNIDLHNSWMIGDEEVDIKAGRTAGCKTGLVSRKNLDAGQILTAETLLEIVNLILGKTT